MKINGDLQVQNIKSRANGVVTMTLITSLIVFFPRPFASPPQIVVTLVGDLLPPVNPRVKQVTTTSFKIEFGQPVTTSLSWFAVEN